MRSCISCDHVKICDVWLHYCIEIFSQSLTPGFVFPVPSTLKAHVKHIFRQKRSRLSSDARQIFREVFCVSEDEATSNSQRTSFMTRCQFKLRREKSTTKGVTIVIDTNERITNDDEMDWTDTVPYLDFVIACQNMFVKQSEIQYILSLQL